MIKPPPAAGRALCAFLSLAAAALCASVQAQTPAAPAPSPRALALAQRYLADAEAEKILAGEGPVVARYMLSKIPEPAGGPAKADEVRQAMLDAADEAVKDKLPEFIQKSAVIYARVYTEKELSDIVAFYDSPSGKAFVAKTSVAAAPMADMIQSLGMEIQIQTRDRFCAREPASCKTTSTTPSAPAPDGAARQQ